MKSAAIIVVLALVAVVRLSMRRRRSRRREPSTASARRTWVNGGVALVAVREVRERVRTRVFKFGTVFILLVVGAAIVIPTVTKSTPAPVRLGIVGAMPRGATAAIDIAASSTGTTLTSSPVASLTQVDRELNEGVVDVVVVKGAQLVVKGPVNGAVSSFLAAAASELGIVRAMNQGHLSAEQVYLLAHASAVPVKSLHPAKSAQHTVNPEALIGDILIFTMLSQYNTWTLMGVMEEKSSRVIEVLLSAVRPMQLLGGKVLGIATVALAQATLVLGFALVLAYSVGSTIVHGASWVTMLMTLLWLVVGYAFYSWVYAAAGSMAERQDQVQSLVLPLSLPMLFGYVTALISSSSGSPTLLLKVLAYLPPTAPFAMPVLVAMHSAAWWQVVMAIAISLASTVVVARFAAGVYRRAILRTGRRVPWREVLVRR